MVGRKRPDNTYQGRTLTDSVSSLASLHDIPNQCAHRGRMAGTVDLEKVRGQAYKWDPSIARMS